ncbi:MAG: hypothetical protein BWY50_01623 [Spirochaetes bacterium ADurb.Bin315]|nr:MAG: hypothetical protein BWY50_01623 [Spirochaetes bacterium ADurb.Bin315]
MDDRRSIVGKFGRFGIREGSNDECGRNIAVIGAFQKRRGIPEGYSVRSEARGQKRCCIFASLLSFFAIDHGNRVCNPLSNAAVFQIFTFNPDALKEGMNDHRHPRGGELLDVEVYVVADLPDEPHRSQEIFNIVEPLFNGGYYGVAHIQDGFDHVFPRAQSGFGH